MLSSPRVSRGGERQHRITGKANDMRWICLSQNAKQHQRFPAAAQASDRIKSENYSARSQMSESSFNLSNLPAASRRDCAWPFHFRQTLITFSAAGFYNEDLNTSAVSGQQVLVLYTCKMCLHMPPKCFLKR